MKTWSNTVQGQRRARLQAGNQRREAEERERLKWDEEFRKDAEARRNVVIERARRAQENERDDVKQLHSRLLLYNVLKVGICRALRAWECLVYYATSGYGFLVGNLYHLTNRLEIPSLS